MNLRVSEDQRSAERDDASHRVDGELVSLLGQTVVDLTVDPLVSVLGSDLGQAGVEGSVLGHRHRVGGGIEEGVQVIGVENLDIDNSGGSDVSESVLVRA